VTISDRDDRGGPARAAVAATLVFAAAAVVALAAKLVIDAARTSDECDTTTTDALELLLWAALASAALAVVVGAVALVTRCGRRVRTVVGMTIGLGVAVLVLLPDGLGLFVCSSSTP
jgi:hypothetical protein